MNLFRDREDRFALPVSPLSGKVVEAIWSRTIKRDKHYLQHISKVYESVEQAGLLYGLL